MSTFAMVPLEAALDHRLTAAQYRVLIAILSFRAKNTDTTWPSRAQLAGRTGYTETTISRYTSELVKLGWLQKEGKGGHSRSCHYRVTVPETVADSATVNGCNPRNGKEGGTVANPKTVNGCEPGNTTVANPKTVAKEKTVANPATPRVANLATPTVANPATPTVANLATRIEQTNEQTNEQTIGTDQGTRGVRKRTPPGATAEVWAAYSAAYEQRYGTLPVRNARVNSQLAQFIQRVPKEEAPHIAAYYVTHNARFYVTKCHPVGLLLSDAEKLRTEWVTRRQVTETAARQTDRSQATVGVFDELRQEISHGTG